MGEAKDVQNVKNTVLGYHIWLDTQECHKCNVWDKKFDSSTTDRNEIHCESIQKNTNQSHLNVIRKQMIAEKCIYDIEKPYK